MVHSVNQWIHFLSDQENHVLISPQGRNHLLCSDWLAISIAAYYVITLFTELLPPQTWRAWPCRFPPKLMPTITSSQNSFYIKHGFLQQTPSLHQTPLMSWEFRRPAGSLSENVDMCIGYECYFFDPVCLPSLSLGKKKKLRFYVQAKPQFHTGTFLLFREEMAKEMTELLARWVETFVGSSDQLSLIDFYFLFFSRKKIYLMKKKSINCSMI